MASRDTCFGQLLAAFHSPYTDTVLNDVFQERKVSSLSHCWEHRRCRGSASISVQFHGMSRLYVHRASTSCTTNVFAQRIPQHSFVTYPTEFVKPRSQVGGQVQSLNTQQTAFHRHPQHHSREKHNRIVFWLLGTGDRELRQGWCSTREVYVGRCGGTCVLSVVYSAHTKANNPLSGKSYTSTKSSWFVLVFAYLPP